MNPLRMRTAWFLTLVLTVTVTAGCTGTRHKDRFRWNQIITSLIESKRTTGDATYLDIRRVMPFGWTRFYVFAPHTTPQEIEDALGFKWGTAKKTGIQERDDITLLVFVTGDAPVVDEYIEHPRDLGDFSTLRAGYPYSPEEAYFEVLMEKRDGETWFVFEEGERPR